MAVDWFFKFFPLTSTDLCVVVISGFRQMICSLTSLFQHISLKLSVTGMVKIWENGSDSREEVFRNTSWLNCWFTNYFVEVQNLHRVKYLQVCFMYNLLDFLSATACRLFGLFFSITLSLLLAILMVQEPV